jgi:hypothetical protein
MVLGKRKKSPRFAVISLLALLLISTLLVFTENLPIFLWLPIMGTAFFFMFLYLFLGSGLSKADSLYAAIRAFSLAEFAASFENQLNNFLYLDKSLPYGGTVVITIIVYLLLFTVAFFLEKRMAREQKPLDVKPKELVAAILIGICTFALSNISFISQNTPFSGSDFRGIMNGRTLFCLAGISTLHFHYAICRGYRALSESAALHNIMETQYAQYQLSKDTIDVLNQKYHDLKHQITFLRQESDRNKRNNILDTMESEIMNYEAQNKTGNAVLDTILTSKTIYCQNKGITFTCVADGSLLGFLEVNDLCALFGNALDNAIESVEHIADASSRLIHLSVSRSRGMLSVRVENYFDGEIEFEDELPKTTKGNPNFHGYGLKSIRHITQQYGGLFHAGTKENWFVLGLLFPLE